MLRRHVYLMPLRLPLIREQSRMAIEENTDASVITRVERAIACYARYAIRVITHLRDTAAYDFRRERHVAYAR